MNIDFILYVQIAIALFTILDPVGVIPLYLSMSQGQSKSERRRQIRRTVIAVAVILTVTALAGSAILDFFGIDIHVFQTAGGIVLLLIALNMLQAKKPLVKTTPKEQSEAIEKEDVSVVPLAMPLLAGPGAISTVIIFSSTMESFEAEAVFVGIIVAVSLTVWPFLTLSKWLGDRIGATGMNIAVRIMGLILASIAVKFILEGIKAYFF